MIDADNCLKATRRALRAFMPDENFAITSLKDPLKLYNTWVLRCKVKGKRSRFVCKLSTTDKAGRAKILNQYDRLRAVKASLPDPLFTAPEVFAFLEEECALIMEDVSGETLRELMPSMQNASEAQAYLRKAGHWIASFQQATMSVSKFEPKPHMGWIAKKIQDHQNGVSTIPDFDAFMVEFNVLEKNAKIAAGLASVRCVSHRDFHLGNVIFCANGATYGIDFENNKEDEALRDVISFVFDFIVRWDRKSADLTGAKTAVNAFWEGYGDQITSPIVVDFFQRFTALNAWSGLRSRMPLNESNQRKLMILKDLAKTPLFSQEYHSPT